jgi:hypothetical protein
VWSDENPHAIHSARHRQQFSVNVWTGIVGDNLRMNWSNIEKWRKLLKIGTIVLSSILKYCAKFKKN